MLRTHTRTRIRIPGPGLSPRRLIVVFLLLTCVRSIRRMCDVCVCVSGTARWPRAKQSSSAGWGPDDGGGSGRRTSVRDVICQRYLLFMAGSGGMRAGERTAFSGVLRNIGAVFEL